MSSTDGLFGYGIYNKNKQYKKYNTEHYYKILYTKYKNHVDSKGYKTYRFRLCKRIMLLL